jgi:hypothetical protein
VGVEIFPVFISREKSKVIQIYGSVEVSFKDERKYYIFKRDEKDSLMLQEHVNTTPILDGSLFFENFSSLGIKFDIKMFMVIYLSKGLWIGTLRFLILISIMRSNFALLF